MLKPAGAACNLACEYCYYSAKTALYPGGRFRMSEETLEAATAAYLRDNSASEVTFGWQGGEALLMGIDFFRRAVALQARHARSGQRALNVLQTNATLVTMEWADFFAEQGFLVGVSIDGPRELHDRYRRDRAGAGSHTRVVRGLQLLQERGVECNALVTVNRGNVEQSLAVYEHLLDLGLRHLQFIPIVERQAADSRKVTPWSVRPEAFGEFLCTIFEAWARRHVGEVFVQIFESALGVWLGGPPALCVFAATCGRALAVEHTGDLYACDHFVFPEHRRGTITDASGALAAWVDGPAQRAFGEAKADLAESCRSCPVLRLCHGDCPKHRLRLAADGRPLSYLCPAYRRFFSHSAEILSAMAGEVRAGRPARGVMEVLQLGIRD